MKLKKYFLTLVFCSIPFVVPWEGATKGTLYASVPASPNGGTGAWAGPATSFLPTITPDLNDLDARDAQNTPIKSIDAHQRLANLFAENLFKLTLILPSHAMQESEDAINAFSRLFKRSFFAWAGPLFRALEEAISPPKRRFVHNVNNLWITLSVGILISILLTRQLTFERTALKLNLRC